MKLKLKLFSSLTLSALMTTYVYAKPIELEFYFPVAVGGSAAQLIEELSSEYASANPEVNINAIYSGSYNDTLSKMMVAAKGGNAPQLTVAVASALPTLIEQELIASFDSVVETTEEQDWLTSFYDGFLVSGLYEGETYGIPFQRSTPIMYWNKDAFAEVGLDPETPPKNWDELVAFASKLTHKNDGGHVEQWGLRIPSADNWLFESFAIQNGVKLANAEFNEVYLNDPRTVEALEFFVSLSKEHEVMAPGVIDWGSTPRSFLEGHSAMMFNTTGNLSNIRQNASFDFGVAMLPGKVRRGSPTGGANFYLLEDSTPEQKKASLDFVRWITSPQQAARWAMGTGYVAPSPKAWETAQLKQYVEEFAYAKVALEQLEYAHPEITTFELPRILSLFTSALHASLTGDKTPQEALDQAQSQADRILRNYK
ncbi:ABC transporter substrate-binding protein [Thaumasiovibrio sp. DFM-14]|uniref:ABC transporter substrate-binding protein n=1 Tax=Thaumasiovibrio sp. DFM-14 TaxID=3384792 RepID=UPI0039A1770C